jgi:hypothetical protein
LYRGSAPRFYFFPAQSLFDNDAKMFSAHRIRRFIRRLCANLHLISLLMGGQPPILFFPLSIGDPALGHWICICFFLHNNQLVIFDSSPSPSTKKANLNAKDQIIKPPHFIEMEIPLQNLWLCRWIWLNRHKDSFQLEHIIRDWTKDNQPDNPLFNYTLDYKEKIPILPRQKDGWSCGYLVACLASNIISTANSYY